VYRWYLSDRFRLVYEHDAEGVATAGSLVKLKEAVRNGLTIKCGIHSISRLAMEPSTVASSSRDDTICFLPSMQPLICDGGANVVMNCDSVLLGPSDADAFGYAQVSEQQQPKVCMRLRVDPLSVSVIFRGCIILLVRTNRPWRLRLSNRVLVGRLRCTARSLAARALAV
jgi:hypothetical protein